MDDLSLPLDASPSGGCWRRFRATVRRPGARQGPPGAGRSLTFSLTIWRGTPHSLSCKAFADSVFMFAEHEDGRQNHISSVLRRRKISISTKTLDCHAVHRRKD
jgi:hypothetical protein